MMLRFTVGLALLALIWMPVDGVVRDAGLREGFWLLKAGVIALGVAIYATVKVADGRRTGRGLIEPPNNSQAPVIGPVLIGILATGFVLRVVGLGEGLWFDEIQTLTRYLREPLSAIVTTFDSQNQHMLYSILARISFLAFGEADWAIRVPALAFGVAGIWATYWFGCQITSRREALFAAAFLAVSYHHVWFSQNARGYGGLLFWTLLSSGFFLQLLSHRTEPSWKPFVGYVIAMSLGVYTHATAAVVGVAHLGIWSVLARRRSRDGFDAWEPAVGVVMAGLVSLTLYAPVLPQFLSTLLEPTMAGQDTVWKNPVWLLTETARGLASGVPGGLVSVAGGAVIFLAGIWSYGKNEFTLVALMCLPGAVMVGAVVAMGHHLWPRLVLFSAGFGVLIVFRGVHFIAKKFGGAHEVRLATAASVILIVGSGMTVPSAWHPKQDFRGAFTFVESQRQPGDAVVVIDMTVMPYGDYLQSDWQAVTDISQLRTLEASHRRTWFVYVFQTRLEAVHTDVWERVQNEYELIDTFPGTVLDGEVVVMRRDASTEGV